MIKIFMGIFLTISLSSASSILPEKAKLTYMMNYDKTTACVVRNLKVYKNPRWVSKIELTNGKELYFSSPKSMIEFYHRPGKWFSQGVKSEKDFKNIIITDYATLKAVNVEDAFFIYGTNEISPAGDDLVAIEGEVEAKVFSARHNGKRVFTFKQVPSGLIKLLNGSI